MDIVSSRKWSVLSELILRIHTAESEAELVRVVTEDLPGLMGGGTFVCWNEHKEEMNLARLFSTETHREELVVHTESLNATFASHPFTEKFDLMNGGEPGIGVFTYRNLAVATAWDETAIYQEVYKSLAMKDQLIASFFFDETHSCNITVNGSERFTESDEQLMADLLPHITLAHRKLVLPASLRKVIESLSSRQKQVAALLNQGRSRKEIAAFLNLSIHTVNDHCAMIYERFCIHSQPELIVLLKRWQPEHEM
ncbi:helix-turn-helix transcriptional regulator [Verrucomicrobiales bacterium BCK34]|nr:helix-turn-helix transcriptional regulator [Verrucomicrobiales bacterium BCK34]